MIVVCSVCNVQLGTKPGRGISHGYCRFHELEALLELNALTAAEAAELTKIREERAKCHNPESD